MIQLRIKYQDILILENACFYYSELDADTFSDKHSYMFKQSVVKHLYNKKIKRLADHPPKVVLGKKVRDKELNLEYFEATIITEIMTKYTFGNNEMAYEKNLTHLIQLMIEDKQLAKIEMGLRRS